MSGRRGGSQAGMGFQQEGGSETDPAPCPVQTSGLWLPAEPAARGTAAGRAAARGSRRAAGKSRCRLSRAWIVTVAHSSLCPGVCDNLAEGASHPERGSHKTHTGGHRDSPKRPSFLRLKRSCWRGLRGIWGLWFPFFLLFQVTT